MDLSSAWKVLVRFQKTIIATSAHMYAKEQEQNLVHEFFEQMPVDLLYACLQDASDRGSAKQVKQACDCINRVLSAEGDGSSLFFQPDIVPYVLAGLAHVETKARVLVLSQFIAQLNRNPPLDKVRVVADAPVLKQICRIIADDDAEVAAKASTVLIKLSGIPDSSFYLVVLDSLKSQRSEIPLNSIEYTRYLETVAKICAQSDTHMNYGISTGAITLILNCLESDDPLFLMNIVDLVPVICQTKLGVQYIFRSDPFVGGNAIRLVGEVSATAAALITESWAWGNATLSKAFLETVESKFQSPDSLQRMAAMDALAAFASSSEKGNELLTKSSNIAKKCLTCNYIHYAELQLLLQHRNICRLWLQSGRSAELTIKTNCCHSLARVLGAPTRLSRKPEEVLEENASIWSMCERLFNSLGEECAQKSTMNLLMNALKQPFHELRTSVFHILRSVAAQNNPWGMRALLSYGGFFEFIMDRNTEPTKETREWKFAVLDAVLASPFKLLLEPFILKKLQLNLNRGPYAGTAVPAELMLESA
ncbi:hypothetical protein CCR75_004994 [Bremia lactucae]|uniref:26S proteasome non-ATPase regulatory subunit 5 n=1 Tax=Bremia lactucae TaxID=4779 RepID=A0A976FQ39_BRELC|nr:hypothetical protein CCR75_004994 [Bremia lactucae]